MNTKSTPSTASSVPAPEWPIEKDTYMEDNSPAEPVKVLGGEAREGIKKDLAERLAEEEKFAEWFAEFHNLFSGMDRDDALSLAREVYASTRKDLVASHAAHVAKIQALTEALEACISVLTEYSNSGFMPTKFLNESDYCEALKVAKTALSLPSA